MHKKGHGQVVNRGELIQELLGVEYLAADTLRLEPEWAAVLLAALVHSGDLVLAVPGRKFDAADLPALAALPLDELIRFRHVERPKDWNVPALKALFELLGLTPGMAILVTQGGTRSDSGAAKDRRPGRWTACGGPSGRPDRHAVLGQEPDRRGGNQAAVLELGTDEILSRESLQAYTSPGRLKNFRHEAGDVSSHASGFESLAEVEALQGLVSEFAPTTAFLTAAEGMLPRPMNVWKK